MYSLFVGIGLCPILLFAFLATLILNRIEKSLSGRICTHSHGNTISSLNWLPFEHILLMQIVGQSRWRLDLKISLQCMGYQGAALAWVEDVFASSSSINIG